ncbi:MAG: hypothetical protein Q7V53_02500 [Caldisericota bacterium]|nr:hypothetical protein [Caldisericota bacterium]
MNMKLRAVVFVLPTLAQLSKGDVAVAGLMHEVAESLGGIETIELVWPLET